MKWYEDYNKFFEEFVSQGINADETTFYFKSESDDVIHYIGYLPQYEKPYWVGCCDVSEGTEFLTAEEMFSAKIFEGMSIKERWNEIVICEFGGISIESYLYKS